MRAKRMVGNASGGDEVRGYVWEWSRVDVREG